VAFGPFDEGDIDRLEDDTREGTETGGEDVSHSLDRKFVPELQHLGRVV